MAQTLVHPRHRILLLSNKKRMTATQRNCLDESQAIFLSE
jgi:hypothetical protein